jgi:DNA-binding CsgD family transcriptional regulator/tetratricopeptide (TPR) repeat protein
MALLERDNFIALLQARLQSTADGEGGHCVFVRGEAGMGKTALVKTFCKQQQKQIRILQGACDGLFTPRPLAPLYDVLWQLNPARWPEPPTLADRSVLFASFHQEIAALIEPVILFFEDIHWADEGTLDFIKFFGRRIDQLPCLFILTYRDNEIDQKHPLHHVLAQLPVDSYTKLSLGPLSKQAVMQMAGPKGYSGEDVYRISGGIPFYVREILASYSPGVPDNIKDAILSVYDKLDEGSRNAWDLFSIIPEGLELDKFRKLKEALKGAINHCFSIAVIVVQNDKVIFKHELYRRTIEESLTVFRRMELNKMILDLFLESFEARGEIERILHYAKNADDRSLVFQYAPLAARKAALMGAHRQAAQLFLTALEYIPSEPTELQSLYEAYAYECYLSNQIKEAIAYTEKVLTIWTAQNQIEKIAATLQFLSRLWWFAGNRKHAEDYAWQAIEMLKDQPSSATRAMALSNVSQLKMLSDEPIECTKWGEEAIAMAKALNNQQILAHALNNVGTAQLLMETEDERGMEQLLESLEIALQYNYDEHAARAYTNLGSSLVKKKNFPTALEMLNAGIRYCEERDLDSWTSYMLSWKARLYFEAGQWIAAEDIAGKLFEDFNQPPITRITIAVVLARIYMRQGSKDVTPYLAEAKKMAFDTMELQRIIPVMVALLEYEWLKPSAGIDTGDLEKCLVLLKRTGRPAEKNELAFWLTRTGRTALLLSDVPSEYNGRSKATSTQAAASWEEKGCRYEQALLLFDGDETAKKKAISIMYELGAVVTAEKMKQEMRDLGITQIPRGIRASTRSNAGLLTSREMDVLLLLQDKLVNRQIAEQLYISPKTVDHHISSILFKLGADSRTTAVENAIRMGLIK